MGYHTELNTLLRPPSGFDYRSLAPGNRYTVVLERERVFPLHIAVLLIDGDWNFFGYCVVHSATSADGKTTLIFEVLTVFSETERVLYRDKFREAAKKTGEMA